MTIQRQVTRFMDGFFEAIVAILPVKLQEGQSGMTAAFICFIGILCAVMSAFNVGMYFYLNSSIHAEFWMGPHVVWVNLLVPVVMIFISIYLSMLSICGFARDQLKLIIFRSLFFAGFVMICAGCWVLSSTATVSNELIYECGRQGKTADLQAEWQRLADFRRACAKDQERDDIYIQQCDGFHELREGHEDMISYLEDMEIEFECQGFCKFWEEPLFTEENSGRRCASAIGEEMYSNACWVGFPTCVCGVLLIGIAFCLRYYEHL